VFVQLALLLVVAFVWLVWQLTVPISHTVVLFLLGIAFAFVLSDPASYLAQRLGGRRSLGIALAYLIAFVIVCGALLLLAAPVAQELKLLDANLSTYQAQLQSQAAATDTAAGQLGINLDFASEVSQTGPATQADVSTALHDVIVVLSAVGGMLANALLVLVVSVYVLTGAPDLQDNIRRAVPRRYRGVQQFVQSNAARVMGAYLRGQLIMALVIGALAAGGTWFLGLPYFLTLGVLAGMFEMVPMFGPILSAIPAVFVALFQPWPTVIWVILYFVIIQQFECNVLGPRVSGHKVGLHPLGAMFALMVGFELAGILGGLFAVPVAGVLWVFVSTAYVHIIGLDQLAEEPAEEAFRPASSIRADESPP
jgi:predicted PurR-regulated permease PerM